MANGPIGFIGLGIMGKPMTRNLLKAGHKLVVYDIVPQAIDEIIRNIPSLIATSKCPCFRSLTSSTRCER